MISGRPRTPAATVFGHLADAGRRMMNRVLAPRKKVLPREQQIARIERKSRLERLREAPGWKDIEEYLSEREELHVSGMAGANVMNPDGQMAYALHQGAWRELRRAKGWIESEIAAGQEAQAQFECEP